MSDKSAAARLAAIRQHVDEGSSRIALFRRLIAQMASRGGDTALGERLLVSMESDQAALEEIWRANAGASEHRRDELPDDHGPSATAPGSLKAMALPLSRPMWSNVVRPLLTVTSIDRDLPDLVDTETTLRPGSTRSLSTSSS